MNATSPPARRILYVVTEDWYFLSHRLPMARAARAAGFDVHVATNVVADGAAIEAEGFSLHRVPFRRGLVSPSALLGTILALRRLYRRIEPDIIHHVALQPVILGSLAAVGSASKCINAVTGLGYTFTTDSQGARLKRRLLMAAMRQLLARRNSHVLVQNDDDRQLVEDIGVATARISVIPGSGVEVDRLAPQPEPPGPPVVAYVGRLLKYKGVRTAIEAQALLRAEGSDVELLIAGTPDPTNPDSLTRDEAEGWTGRAGVTWLGHVRDIATVWARASIAVLPSHGEGVPKSLLEAAACGRAMIATDVPGCRDVVRDGETGLLVPVDDAKALAEAIRRLANAPDLRARYGAAARKLAVERFSDRVIGRQTVELYRTVLNT